MADTVSDVTLRYEASAYETKFNRLEALRGRLSGELDTLKKLGDRSYISQFWQYDGVDEISNFLRSTIDQVQRTLNRLDEMKADYKTISETITTRAQALSQAESGALNLAKSLSQYTSTASGGGK